mmetsp:Transcript_52682/g.133749  ORF Transcript_52682/g.133749 Transcript_52682/m.133749 type:complete len:388 (-) Transcript_52682:71-1234(-)
MTVGCAPGSGLALPPRLLSAALSASASQSGAGARWRSSVAAAAASRGSSQSAIAEGCSVAAVAAAATAGAATAALARGAVRGSRRRVILAAGRGGPPEASSGRMFTSRASSTRASSGYTAAAAGAFPTAWPTSAAPPGRWEEDQGSLPWKSLRGSYCINLDRRPERWSFMQDHFARLRLPVRRWSAVDGRDLDVEALAEGGLIDRKAMPRYRLPDDVKLFGVDLTAGGIGCALSHMQIWKDVVENYSDEDGWFLVVEDDCDFSADFSEEVLAKRLSQVPSDSEMVFLGGQDLMRRQAALEVAPGVRRLYRGFRETTAYLVTVAGCKACLEVSVPMSWQIDTHLTENEVELKDGLSYTFKPRGYCLFPPLVEQERSRFKTDVQKQEHD